MHERQIDISIKDRFETFEGFPIQHETLVFFPESVLRLSPNLF